MPVQIVVQAGCASFLIAASSASSETSEVRSSASAWSTSFMARIPSSAPPLLTFNHSAPASFCNRLVCSSRPAAQIAHLWLSVAVRPQFPFTHGFVNTGAGPTVAGAKLDGRLVAPQAGQSEPTPKLSFTGDVGIPNNHTLDDVLRQQYRGPAAMENDSVAGKFVNTIGALKLGIKVDY